MTGGMASRDGGRGASRHAMNTDDSASSAYLLNNPHLVPYTASKVSAFLFYAQSSPCGMKNRGNGSTPSAVAVSPSSRPYATAPDMRPLAGQPHGAHAHAQPQQHATYPSQAAPSTRSSKRTLAGKGAATKRRPREMEISDVSIASARRSVRDKTDNAGVTQIRRRLDAIPLVNPTLELLKDGNAPSSANPVGPDTDYPSRYADEIFPAVVDASANTIQEFARHMDDDQANFQDQRDRSDVNDMGGAGRGFHGQGPTDPGHHVAHHAAHTSHGLSASQMMRLNSGAPSGGMSVASVDTMDNQDMINQLRLVSEILFFAGMNKQKKLERVIRRHSVDVREVCDYDGRTPLHLAASEGALTTTEWLLEQNVNENAVDRFGRTPLMEALVYGHHRVGNLIQQAGGKIYENEQLLDVSDPRVNVTPGADSAFGMVRMDDFRGPMAATWEIPVNDLDFGTKLGVGQFSVVYAGRWNGTPVAIKQLKADVDIRPEEFEAEISILQRLHHPHIVQFLGAVTNEATPYYIVTEMMEGRSLEHAFRAGERFHLRRALEIALDCARGMNYLHLGHPNPIMHRDLKPSNIMLTGRMPLTASDEAAVQELVLDIGVAKIADFGLSKALVNLGGPPSMDSAEGDQEVSQLLDQVQLGRDGEDGHQHGRNLARMSGHVGTLRYMAGEVYQGEVYDEKADVYSFAMIMFELVSGEPPFEGMEPSVAAMLAADKTKNLRPKFPNIRNLSTEDRQVMPKVQQLIARCWHQVPSMRPGFDKVLVDLESMLANYGSPRPRYETIMIRRNQKKHVGAKPLSDSSRPLSQTIRSSNGGGTTGSIREPSSGQGSLPFNPDPSGREYVPTPPQSNDYMPPTAFSRPNTHPLAPLKINPEDSGMPNTVTIRPSAEERATGPAASASDNQRQRGPGKKFLGLGGGGKGMGGYKNGQ